jgi:phage terminase Nu1 subunit (DNA packaging protein)
MPEVNGLSQAALARAIGLSPAMIVKLKGRGMPIHSVEAALAWREENQRQYMKPDGAIKVPPPAPPADDNDDDDDEVPDFRISRARREAALADQEEMQAAKMRGDLIATEDVARQWAAEASRQREAWLQFADRLAPLLEMRGLAFIRQTLDAEVRQILNGLAA